MKQLNSTYSIFINKSIELKKNIHTHIVALHHATLKKTTKDPIAVLKQKLNKAIKNKNTKKNHCCITTGNTKRSNISATREDGKLIPR